jgi:hypothetical protein
MYSLLRTYTFFSSYQHLFQHFLFILSTDATVPLGRIALVNCLVGQSGQRRGGCFAITTPNKRTYLLSASSSQEQMEWMSSIQKCIETTY